MVIGKMAASGPWIADSSALLALAIPPNHSFDLSDPEEDGKSSNAGSGDDNDDEWSDDDDDANGAGGRPLVGGYDGGYATHVARSLQSQQGAGMRARPLTEIDPLQAATGIPLRDWTVMLLLDDNNDDNNDDNDNDDLEANAGRIGSSFSEKSNAVVWGRLTGVAVPWIESVLAPLLAEHQAEKAAKQEQRRTNNSGGSNRGPRNDKAVGVRLCVLNDSQPVGRSSIGVVDRGRLGPGSRDGFGGFYTQSAYHVQPEYQNDRYDDTFDNYPPYWNAQSAFIAAQGSRALMVQVPKALTTAAIARLRAAAAAAAAASLSSNDAVLPSGGALIPFKFQVVPVHTSDGVASSSPSASLPSTAAPPAAPLHLQRSCNFVRAIVTGASDPNNNNSGRSAGLQLRGQLPGLRALAAPPLSLLTTARDTLRGDAHALRRPLTRRQHHPSGGGGGGRGGTVGDTGLVLAVVHASTRVDRSRATVAALKQQQPQQLQANSSNAGVHPLRVYFSLVSCQRQREMAAPQPHHSSRRRGPYAAPLPPPPAPTVVDICDDESSKRFISEGTLKVLAVVPRRAKSAASSSVVSQTSPGSGSSSSVIDSKHDVLFYPPSSTSTPPLPFFFPEMRTAQVYELAHVQPNRHVGASLRRSRQEASLPTRPSSFGAGAVFGVRHRTHPLTKQWMKAELFDRARYRTALRGPATGSAGATCTAATTPTVAAAADAPKPSTEDEDEEDEDDEEVELPLAATVLSPVEHYFGECTVCYDLIPTDSFANFCFREFHIDAHSVQVRSLRARAFRAHVYFNKGWIGAAASVSCPKIACVPSFLACRCSIQGVPLDCFDIHAHANSLFIYFSFPLFISPYPSLISPLPLICFCSFPSFLPLCLLLSPPPTTTIITTTTTTITTTTITAYVAGGRSSAFWHGLWALPAPPRRSGHSKRPTVRAVPN